MILAKKSQIEESDQAIVCRHILIRAMDKKWRSKNVRNHRFSASYLDSNCEFLINEYFSVSDCWSDKTNNLKLSHLALGTFFII